MRRSPTARSLTAPRRRAVPALGVALLATAGLVVTGLFGSPDADAGGDTPAASARVVAPGWHLTISGHGCAPDSSGAGEVDAWIDQNWGARTSTSPHDNGTWSLSVLVPSATPTGEHELYAQCHYQSGAAFSFDSTVFDVAAADPAQGSAGATPSPAIPVTTLTVATATPVATVLATATPPNAATTPAAEAVTERAGSPTPPPVASPVATPTITPDTPAASPAGQAVDAQPGGVPVVASSDQPQAPSADARAKTTPPLATPPPSMPPVAAPPRPDVATASTSATTGVAPTGIQ